MAPTDQQDQALWRLGACELQRRYREGSTTPLAVVQACLERLDAVNPRLNAIVARRDDALLAEAAQATERLAQGRPRSALDGIPLSVKDSLLCAGLPTTWGTAGLRGHDPGSDELAVTRARAAGALIIGKTNVPEFALEGYTDNPLFGPTFNPWQLQLTPGGSSGGAVAAVAAGIGPLAIGQDGGGSIRRPASHTGLVGLKPSLGAWPREHVLPSLLLDFEVIGPLARSVADARMLFELLRGPAAVDRSSLAAAQAATRLAPAAGPLRILAVERFDAAPLDPQIAASFGQATATLEQLGHRVDSGRLPLDLGFFTEAWPQIGQIGLARLFERHPAWADAASDKYLAMAAAGRALPATRLLEVIEQVTQLRRAAATLFDSVDVILLPSAAALPWPARQSHPAEIDNQPVGPRGHAIYTGWVNAAGLPALALPAAPSRDGLPIGIQLVGPYGGDDRLLELGAAYEAAAPWAHRWPAL